MVTNAGTGDSAQHNGQPASLADLSAGSRARIVEIRGGAAMVRRFLALGLAVGAEITVSHERTSGVVAAHGGNRIALGSDMAEKVRVEPIT